MTRATVTPTPEEIKRLAILTQLTTLYPMSVKDEDIDGETLRYAGCTTIAEYRRFARAVMVAYRTAEEQTDFAWVTPASWKLCVVTANTPEAEVGKQILASVK